MSEIKEGIIVILSSPSGAGKTTLVKEISKRNKFQISISHTTRKPRLNETDGKDYFFVSESKFKLLIDENKFLEYAKVFNHYYGSSKDLVIEKQQAIIKKQAPHRKWLWFAGGVVLGGATYYGIQQAAK